MVAEAELGERIMRAPILRRTWLSQSDVTLDAKGFVRTGSELEYGCLPLQTSRDGIFAIGDVRPGSTKRVAVAVGEGAQVIATVHAVLPDADNRSAG